MSQPRRKSQNQPMVVLGPDKHPLVDEMLADEAIWILNRLLWHGYQAYLVGGGVRDLMLGQSPKDFDLTTDARPEDLKKIFYNCRIIGRRFRIVHVYFRDGSVFEVSTFRALPSNRGQRHSPQRDDNTYGTPREDALRRDITINGLFYDIGSGEIIDYVGGLADLQDGIVRTIGQPRQRFREDPVRMVRALRHAARHNFAVEDNTWEAIQLHSKEMRLCSNARLLEEFLKDLRGGYSADSFSLMMESHLLRGWLPQLNEWLHKRSRKVNLPPDRFGPFLRSHWASPQAFWKLLETHDAHIQAGHELSDLVLMGSLCVPIGWNYVARNYRSGKRTRQLWHRAISQSLQKILQELTLSSYHWHELSQLLQTYWRLHLVPQQPGIVNSLNKSEYLPEAVQIFALELEAQGQPIPEWLSELNKHVPPITTSVSGAAKSRSLHAAQS
ncbi:MAG: CCA tRNA nucleotidyltransferase [Deltaproteobacteria bacterium]|nr:MAG: CCA tRNA nucleotidyltransferase [Deltaproteobacteria bacterium]